ncbi:MAG TPA: transposase [Vicinamibacterales bacterium]|nr:transposase [Vicinamibacterales bacterium]
MFHVLNRSAKRARLFEHAADFSSFEHLLSEGVDAYRIALFAYCIMPNHWHLLLMPTVDGSLSRFMHWLTTTHSRRWQLAHDAEGAGAVYQGRFKSLPVGNDSHFLWVCRYVERNALRANLVDTAESWRWSSLWHRHRATDARWLAPCPVALPSGWVGLVNEPQTDAELAAFRRAIHSGEPFGTPEWRHDISRDLSLKTRPRGRQPRLQTASVLNK